MAMQYKVVEDNILEINMGNASYQWNYTLSEAHTYQMLEFEIVNISGAPYRLYDVTRPYFRVQVNSINRKLFAENFGEE